MSAWERALSGSGGGSTGTAIRRAAVPRRTTTPRPTTPKPPAAPRFALPTGALGPGFQPTPQDYAAAGRMASNAASQAAFGPERDSWIPNFQSAPKLERTIRDWGLSEQELRASGSAFDEGRPLAGLGWGALGLAGAVPLFGWAGRGLFKGAGAVGDVVRAAGSAAPPPVTGLQPRPRPPSGPPPLLDDPWGPGVTLSPGPQPRPRPPSGPPPLSNDPWGPMPAPSGPQPRPRPTELPSSPSGPRPRPRSEMEDFFRQQEEVRQRSLQVAAQREAEAQTLLRQREADRLMAMQEVRRALDAPYALELPRAASMGQRTGPLADLRINTGSGPGVTSGTRASIHDFPIPFDQALAMPFSQRMAAPFVDAGLLRPRPAGGGFEAGLSGRLLDEFRTLSATSRGGNFNPRRANPYEVRQAEQAINDLIPSFRERFVETPPGINRTPTPGQSSPFPFGAALDRTTFWDDRTRAAINRRATAELLEEVTSQVGKSPYLHHLESLDSRAIQQMLEGIESGTVSSRMYPEGLEYLLSTGEAPTAFRTGKTGADQSSNVFSEGRRRQREITEYPNFGIPLDADASVRPYYGYVQGREGAPAFPGSQALYPDSTQYGPITARWSDAVRGNSSFTLGDSLNMAMETGQTHVPRPLTGLTPEDILFAGGGGRGGARSGTSSSAPYAEVQMFGGPGPQDLSSLIVNSNYADKITDLLRRYNVDIPVQVNPEPWNNPLRP